jgi:hypothetical protein
VLVLRRRLNPVDVQELGAVEPDAARTLAERYLGLDG